MANKKKFKKKNSLKKDTLNNNKLKKTPSKKNKKKFIQKNKVNSSTIIDASTSFKKISKNSIIAFSLLFLACILFLIGRLFYLQFILGASLKQAAYNQQTTNQIISPKRGNIYDSTGKALAISAQVDTVTINPSLIIVKDNESETIALKEKIATGLSTIFELNYDSVLTTVSKNSQFETIIRKVEQDKINELKEWMSENKIYSGIYIEEDNKRYYPYGTTASAVLGFCNIDNQGAYGIEETWNSVLSGNSRKTCKLSR